MKVNNWQDQQECFSFLLEPQQENQVKPPFDPFEVARLAAQGVYLGTSSWKYRGWEGMLYKGGYSSEAQFQRQSLREYTSYLPCVGVDFTFYAWPMVEMMNYLIESTPENFRLCPKVTKRITMDVFPNIATYGKWAGQENPDFLNPGLFEEQFLTPIRRLGSRLGAVFFEFTNLSEQYLSKFERFFSTVPRDLPYGIEIRSPELLSSKLYALLRRLELSPIFNSWSRMPRIRQQWDMYSAAAETPDRSPIYIRGLLRPGRSYEDAVRLFQPYNKIQDAFPEVREDIAKIIRVGIQQNRKVFVFINNRLEGSAPHTIGGIMELLRGQ